MELEIKGKETRSKGEVRGTEFRREESTEEKEQSQKRHSCEEGGEKRVGQTVLRERRLEKLSRAGVERE
jgi:hypothetical protein